MRFLREKFATRLAHEMDRSKLKQAEVARRLGVSDPSVYRWLQGKAFPEDDILVELCNLFGVKAADWFGLPEEPAQDETLARQARQITDLESKIKSLESKTSEWKTPKYILEAIEKEGPLYWEAICGDLKLPKPESVSDEDVG